MPFLIDKLLQMTDTLN